MWNSINEAVKKDYISLDLIVIIDEIFVIFIKEILNIPNNIAFYCIVFYCVVTKYG